MRVSQLRAHRLEEVVVCDVVYYWGLTKKPVVFLSDQGKKILLASLEATINSQADETQGEPSSRRTPARRRGKETHGKNNQPMAGETRPIGSSPGGWTSPGTAPLAQGLPWWDE